MEFAEFIGSSVGRQSSYVDVRLICGVTDILVVLNLIQSFPNNFENSRVNVRRLTAAVRAADCPFFVIVKPSALAGICA